MDSSLEGYLRKCSDEQLRAMLYWQNEETMLEIIRELIQKILRERTEKATIQGKKETQSVLCGSLRLTDNS